MSEDLLFSLSDKTVVQAVSRPELIPTHNRLLALIKTIENQGWKKANGMTQLDQIFNHITKNGSITQREAMIDYSIQSFHKRISELRSEGFRIIGELRSHPVTGQKYTRYKFED